MCCKDMISITNRTEPDLAIRRKYSCDRFEILKSEFVYSLFAKTASRYWYEWLPRIDFEWCTNVQQCVCAMTRHIDDGFVIYVLNSRLPKSLKKVVFYAALASHVSKQNLSEKSISVMYDYDEHLYVNGFFDWIYAANIVLRSVMRNNFFTPFCHYFLLSDTWNREDRLGPFNEEEADLDRETFGSDSWIIDKIMKNSKEKRLFGELRYAMCRVIGGKTKVLQCRLFWRELILSEEDISSVIQPLYLFAKEMFNVEISNNALDSHFPKIPKGIEVPELTNLILEAQEVKLCNLKALIDMSKTLVDFKDMKMYIRAVLHPNAISTKFMSAEVHEYLMSEGYVSYRKEESRVGAKRSHCEVSEE